MISQSIEVLVHIQSARAEVIVGVATFASKVMTFLLIYDIYVSTSHCASGESRHFFLASEKHRDFYLTRSSSYVKPLVR